MSQVASAHSEKEFASNYLTLLSVSESQVVLDDSYRKDLRDINTLGIKLPTLPNPKKSSKKSKNEDKLINATFKSIKPPKFNVTSEFNSITTIFEIKTDLIKSKELQEFQASQLKFLVKGKVIQDSALLNAVVPPEDDSITFTVMINKEKPSTPSAIDQEPEEPSIENIKPEIQIPWKQIKELVSNEGLDSEYVIARLQKGWELTK